MKKKILKKIIKTEKPEKIDMGETLDGYDEISARLFSEPVSRIPEDIEITPKRDFHIVQNEVDIIIKAGVPVTIPRRFLQNMVTEKVIDKIPN